MNHGNGYPGHGVGMPMQHQHPGHPQHMGHPHHQQYHHHHMLPQQPQPPQMLEHPGPQVMKRSSSSRKYQSLQRKSTSDKGKGGSAMQQKELAKLRESYLKQRFALIVMQRQLHVANSRLNCAIEGLKLAKESKPFHKFFVQAMDEKRHIKSVPKAQEPAKNDDLDLHTDGGRKGGKGLNDVSTETKIVTTKKGERQRPYKYTTRSKDEMTVIACAADYVVAGTATLREAKDALREMGIFHFETSLSNKMYNHPDKKYYLKMRKEKREEKKLESSKKSEIRQQRKKSKERESEIKEQRKRQKRQKKNPQQQQVPIIHDVQTSHLAYGHPAHLQGPVPQIHYPHHEMHRL